MPRAKKRGGSIFKNVNPPPFWGGKKFINEIEERGDHSHVTLLGGRRRGGMVRRFAPGPGLTPHEVQGEKFDAKHRQFPQSAYYRPP